jgi:hypothetical protein
VPVAEQFLHLADVDARLEQERRRRRPERIASACWSRIRPSTQSSAG